jgi:XTP/dITP diphosphohydrolase
LAESLLLATTNLGKIREMSAYLEAPEFEILGLRALPRITPFPEDGRSFMENARGKSLYYGRRWGGLTLGEDSGLEIDALDGAPGVRSARFAGPGATDAENIGKVLRLLSGVPPERRKARFVCCMVLSEQGRVLTEIRACVRGSILERTRGGGGFGYDPIFFMPALDKTFAELDPGEKNRISHRGRALRKLRLFLQNRFRT